MVHNRRSAGRKHPRYLPQIGRLIARRHVNENIERPHSPDRTVGYAGQIAPGAENVLDVCVTAQTLSTQLQLIGTVSS
jgi:hypothetical protein